MFSAEIKGKSSTSCEFRTSNGQLQVKVGDQLLKGSLVKISPRHFHFILGNGSFNTEVLRVNPEEKTLLLRINGKRVEVKLRDKYDELLHSLGMDDIGHKKINDIKAPMPGMVLNVLVKDGDVVKKGDPILVLEAMKMENILKSPADGVVKKVSISKGTAVEKNQLLVQF